MLKVECESCKAPYQIDEKRIPAVGLKMRCPKCGHSFLVKNTGVESAAALPDVAKPAVKIARPAVNLKSTMVGVAPSGPSESASLPRPPISDFPGALGSLDEPGLPAAIGARSLDLDLPAVAGNLPAASPPRGAPPRPAPAAKAPTFELDLPSLPDDLPSRSRDAGSDLPAVAGDLPAVFGGAATNTHDAGGAPRGARSTAAFGDIDLPVAASNLPSPSGGNLPAVASNLPSVSRGGVGLPAVSSGNLPVAASNLPSVSANLPVASGFGAVSESSESDASPFGDFGELDLPKELPAPVGQGAPAGGADAGFGELDLGGAPADDGYGGGGAEPSRQEPDEAAGGMGFGELDFGESGGESEIATEASIPTKDEDTAAAPSAGIEGGDMPELAAQVPHDAAPDERREEGAARAKSRRGLGIKIGAVAVVAVLLGGAALQLTSYGAYGYLRINDGIHTQDYVRIARDSSDKARKSMAPDTFTAAKATVDELGKTQKQWPRARALTAYAALTSFIVDLRFGQDGSRKGRAQQWLAELPPTIDATLRQVTEAGLTADNGDYEKARKALESAARRDPKDPLQLDIAILRGEIELRSKSGAAAIASFQRALELSNTPRANYGLARAYFMTGEFDKAKKAVDATLVGSPDHSAKIIRAAIAFRSAHDEDGALKDINAVLDGSAKENASPEELALAYAIRGDVLLQRGATMDAGKAYDEALKSDTHSVAALVGRGEAFFRDGRYAEALARFDTAVDADKTSTRAIAGDAKTKIKLERLADAKMQLAEARAKYPKDWQIAYWLGQSEVALGNKKPAEAELRSAVELVDPTDDDAVVPFVGLSSFLAAQGRAADAEKVLEEAQKKLPDSALMQRAVGQVAAVQADYDKAVAHFRLALEKDPKDLATRFQLATTLRRVRRFDESSAEFEKIAAADPNYPSLALERGLLYEESGDVKKALEQFQSALAKAPNDPDLQLRIGSAYVSINRPAEAMKMLSSVLDARPGSAEAHHFMGRAKMITPGTPETEVMRSLKHATDLDPNRAEYHLYVGWAANEAHPQQLALAKSEIEKALSQDKLLADAYWQYGSLLRKEGAVEDSLRNLKRALELKPTRYEIHAALAETYEDKNDRASAFAEWSKAIAADDTRPFWRYRYGRLLFDRGSMAEAVAHLRFAADTMTDSPRPAWAISADFMAAEALKKTGKRAESVPYYKRFLDMAQANSPDRKEAQKSLDEIAPPR